MLIILTYLSNINFEYFLYKEVAMLIRVFINFLISDFFNTTDGVIIEKRIFETRIMCR